MKILFLHRNFPAQFRHLAAHFAQDPNNQVVFITGRKEDKMPGVNKLVYNITREVPKEAHRYLRFFEESIIHGQAASQVALALKKQGFIPDIIIGHSWGTTLFMKDIFPDSPLLCYLEWFYRAYGSDVDFEIKKPLPVNLEALLRVKNSHILIDLYTCDHGISPTNWQFNQFPPEYKDKISIIHDGINTDQVKPEKEAKLVFPHLNLDLSEVDEIITYVSRGLEPYRGFHKFMEAVPLILEKRPKAHIVIVGEDRVYYGSTLPDGKTYKQAMLEKFPVDLSRVHFTGRLLYEIYLKVLQCSSVHVYLTYPFVLSWSMIEAMSAGCLVVGSDTPPVREVIKHGENGLLADFFSPQDIADKVCEVLDHPDKMNDLRVKARETVLENYDLKKLLPKQIELVNKLLENSRKG